MWALMIAVLLLPTQQMSMTVAGEGVSICNMGPDGIQFDFGTVAYGATKYGYIKNRGAAACMVQSITIDPPAGTELTYSIPGLVLADNPVTEHDESSAEVWLRYEPDGVGVDHFDIDIRWRTARNLGVIVSEGGGGTVSTTIDGVWARAGDDGYILIPAAEGIPGSVTINAYPADGYTFQGWTVDGIPAQADNPVVFEMPNNDVSIMAVFAAIP